MDPVEIALKEWKIDDDKKQIIEQKKEPEVEEIIEKIKDDELV
jgi:hypothetical protein